MSKHTVKLYLDHFHSLGRTKEDLFKLSDFELNKLFHPPKETPVGGRLQLLFDYFPVMEAQLRRRGMTVSKQFLIFKSLLTIPAILTP